MYGIIPETSKDTIAQRKKEHLKRKNNRQTGKREREREVMSFIVLTTMVIQYINVQCIVNLQ